MLEEVKKTTQWVVWGSLLVFLWTWYDTAQGHLWTAPLNDWLLATIYVSTDVTGLKAIYREALLGITALGSDIVFVLFSGLILLDLLRQRKITAFAYALLALLVIIAIVEGLKYGVYSLRPMNLLEHDSFPSGHVARVSIWCGLLLLLNHLKVYDFSRYWSLILWCLPLLVSFTRLGLGRHWLDDVLASYALNIFIFYWVAFIASPAKQKKI